jgi:hypothetical protein
LEGASAVCGVDLGAEDEGVATVVDDSCLDEDQTVEFAMRSSARSPTWHASDRCFRPATYQGEYPR